jgi:hypothetical protein
MYQPGCAVYITLGLAGEFMPSSSNEWIDRFSGRRIDEMIPYLGRVFQGTSFNELAAAYQKMLEIAFHEHETENDDRADAAAWANVLNSLMVVALVGHEESLKEFLRARNMSMKNAENYGYGSIGYMVRYKPAGPSSSISDESEDERNLERQLIEERRAFLLSVSFGRAVDARSEA